MEQPSTMSPALGLSSWRWSNNTKSIILLCLLPVLLLAILGGTFLLAGFLSRDPEGYVDPRMVGSLFGFSSALPTDGIDPLQFAATGIYEYWPIVLGLSAIWMLIGYWFNSSMIRAATGARAVTRQEQPKLYNLLENLCISRGIIMPKLCMIDSGEMNAYASGINKGSYSITVTRGLKDTLTDAEMEAVLAHELTHIRNGDVRLLIITIVFTGMLSFLAQLLWRNLRVTRSRRSRDDGRGAAVMMIAAAIMLVVGYMLGMLLRFALSRRREYLADAGAVELVKTPEPLISALTKISSNPRIPNVPPDVEQLFIENPPSAFGLFDTHPKIDERIKVLRALGGLPPQGQSTIPSFGG